LGFELFLGRRLVGFVLIDAFMIIYDAVFDFVNGVTVEAAGFGGFTDEEYLGAVAEALGAFKSYAALCFAVLGCVLRGWKWLVWHLSGSFLVAAVGFALGGGDGYGFVLEEVDFV